MTNEEREDAIKFFNEVAEKEVNNAKYSKLAIEALEQQTCEDCISRQEAINCVTLNEFRYKIVEDMKTLPSVVPKEKTGKWIKYSIPRCGEQHYQCTSCGYYINFGQWGEVYTKQFKYCPNCGAKMVKPQESENKE